MDGGRQFIEGGGFSIVFMALFFNKLMWFYALKKQTKQNR